VTLAEILQSAPPRLAGIPEEEAARRPGEGRWSKKEILGHLIDSASNNHQRFVRAQFVDLLEIPTYEQERWVSTQEYASERWPDLVNLWVLLNRHLLHVMERVPDAARSHAVAIGGLPPVTLEFVIQDYIRHMEHHLAQILG
jgi:hypothetical protein